MYRKKTFFIIIIAFIFALFLNFFLHWKIFNFFIAKNSNENILIPNRKFINMFSPDFSKPILADYYWIKFIGNLDISKNDNITGEKLYNYTMLITDLDPYFYLPYILAGSFLTSEKKFNMFNKGAIILKKGIYFLPEKWQLSFLLGYLSFFEQNKVEEGIKYLKKCLTLKTTPPDIKKLIRFIILNFSLPEIVK